MNAAKKTPLMPSDVAAILKAMQMLSEQDEWVIRLCIYHGCRSSEVIQL
jgi:integrase